MLQSITLRTVQDADLIALADLLNHAFASHDQTLWYTPELVASAWQWEWQRAALSLVAEHDDRLVGAAMVALRPALLRDEPLLVAHIGPVAVDSLAQGKGIGSRLLMAAEAAARAAGADLLALGTEERFPAHRLYRRLGYRVVERSRTAIALLDGRRAAVALGHPWLGAALSLLQTRGRVDEGVRFHSGADALATQRAQVAPRDGALRELPLPPRPAMAHHLGFTAECGDAALGVVFWPVLARPAGREVAMRVVQVLWAAGSGQALTRATDAALLRAREEGAASAFALAGVAHRVPRLRLPGGPMVLRMAKGLTDAGSRRVATLRAWDEWAPSP